jgi:hypothetical protein
MTDPIVAVAQQLNDPANGQNLQYAQLRQGVITAINAGDNSCSLNLSGDVTTTVAGVKCLLSYQPVVGDTIWLVKSGSDMIGLGKVGLSTAGAFAQAQNFVTASNVISSAGVFFDLSSTPNSVTMTKRFSTSNLFVNLSITGYADVISGGMIAAVQIGATDYVCASITLDRLVDSASNTDLRSARGTAAGSTVIPSLAAGSVTAKIRIKNNVAGSNLHVDSGDYYSLTVQEVL